MRVYSINWNDGTEWQIAKDVEGSGYGLIQGTIPSFVWRDWENHKKSKSG
jgi:hypothetical protein